MLFGLVLTFSTNNSVFRLYQILFILFSLPPLASLLHLKGDDELINLVDLLIWLPPYVFHSCHFWRSFFSFSNTSPKLDKLFHCWHLCFMYLLSSQRSEESHLVLLKRDIVMQPSPFFFTFFQLYLLVPLLLQPLLPFISQVVIKSLNSLMISFSFLVVFLRFLLLYSSLLLFPTIWCNSLISFFNFRSYLFPPLARFFFISPWLPSINFPSLKPIAFPIAYTLSHISGMVSASVRYISNIRSFNWLSNLALGSFSPGSIWSSDKWVSFLTEW